MSPSGHILIIDDEAVLRQTLARILQRASYQVTTAANGDEALSLLASASFDLIYMDIRMPGMSGLDLLKHIHTSHPSLPVILFTAQPDMNSAVEALRRGATDYLLKPLKPNVLIERTQAILAQQEKERRKHQIRMEIDSAFAFTYGICHGIRVPAQLGILEQTFGLKSLGQLVGISTAIGQLCGATAPYAMGFVYDQTGSYSKGFYILGAMLVATGILVFMLKEQPQPAPETTDG